MKEKVVSPIVIYKKKPATHGKKTPAKIVVSSKKSSAEKVVPIASPMQLRNRKSVGGGQNESKEKKEKINLKSKGIQKQKEPPIKLRTSPRIKSRYS